MTLGVRTLLFPAIVYQVSCCSIHRQYIVLHYAYTYVTAFKRVYMQITTLICFLSLVQLVYVMHTSTQQLPFASVLINLACETQCAWLFKAGLHDF
jgi:hypothetical protein